MSAIALRLRSLWPEVTLVVLSATNLVVALVLRDWEIIPFHLVWAALAVLFGLRVWSVRRTALVLGGVIAVTGLPLLYSVSRGLEPVAELSEVPLISAIFLAMIWGARRYQAALTDLRRLTTSQRGFVRDASHELRTPITVASGHAELILRSSDRQAVADAEIVLDELGRLSRLAERLLLLAATDRPDFLHTRPTELGPMLETTLKRWQPTAQRSWRLERHAEGGALLDEERIQIALDALIENAITFTREGDGITLAVSGVDGRAVIEVSDTGVGIALDRQERIFERFARTDEGRARPSGGTGLGLAIVKAIVEAHGGTLSVESKPGHGALFRIVLPGFEPSGVRRRKTVHPGSSQAQRTTATRAAKAKGVRPRR
jgi:two-component system OmpR family sensor kinase